MENKDMYQVNISMIEGMYVVIASGHPKLTAGPQGSVKFYDNNNNFVLHLMKGDTCMGIVTPGRMETL